MNFDEKTIVSLSNLFRARFPYIYISTWEEQRACELIDLIASTETYIKIPRTVFTWTQTDGIVNGTTGSVVRETQSPISALNFVRDNKEDALFVFKDLHAFLGTGNRPADSAVVRKMRDIIPELRSSENRENIVIIAPELVIPDDLQKEISIFDFPLPTVHEIRELMDDIVEENELQTDLSDENLEILAKAALGLTLQEAENAFSRAIVTNHGLDENALKVVFEEKNQVIKKNGILEFVNSDVRLEDIGGLENLKSWLNKRNNSWLDAAKKYNLPAPKGILITGIPGCGKSLTAKAMSAIWHLPLLKLDMGKIFSGIVGSSEQNMRRALTSAEATAPSILWIDEIEKGLAGTGSNGDSGTSTRIFGTFLTWMQEKTAPVFVIATANDISGLPPELLRKGRFDEIFFIDLPTQREREKIFEVHINKMIKTSEAGKDLVMDEPLLHHLAELSEGFIGAEIEQAVISAMYEAFFAQRNVEVADLELAIRNTVPLSVTQKEQIRRLREWANVRAVSATARDDLQNYQKADPAPDMTTPSGPDKEDSFSASRGGRQLDF